MARLIVSPQAELDAAAIVAGETSLDGSYAND